MTNDPLRTVSLHIAIRLFVVVLAVMAGNRSVQAEAGQQVAIDLATVPIVSTQEAQQTPSLTPIRRATDPHVDSGERVRPSSLTSRLALLGLVLGGTYIALNMLRRRQNVRSAQTHAIDLLASRRLDGQSTLHLVHIGRRVLAVGSSAGGTRILAVIEDPEEIAQLISASGDPEKGNVPHAWRPFQRRGAAASDGTNIASPGNESPLILGGSRRPA